MEIVSYTLWFIASVALLVRLVGGVIEEESRRRADSECAWRAEGK